jgi:hypothetical protein
MRVPGFRVPGSEEDKIRRFNMIARAVVKSEVGTLDREPNNIAIKNIEKNGNK